MSCEDCQAMLLRSPTSVTRGERFAVFNHISKCPTCENFMDTNGPRVASLSKIIQLAFDDAADDECPPLPGERL